FLAEAGSLAIVGAASGAVFGVGAAYAFARFSGWDFVSAPASLPLGMGTASSTGSFFGCAVRMLIVALGLAASSPVARAGDEPLPSRPTMRYQAPAVLGEGVVDSTLTDAVFLGLRANRGIRSAYSTRVAQKFDSRVAEDFFSPKLLVTGQITGNRKQDERSRQGLSSSAATMVGEFGTRFGSGWTSQLSNANRAGGFRDDGVT
ncbi:hypothetical protein OY671_009190, partial [Metschnikowia pulcherrima]